MPENWLGMPQRTRINLTQKTTLEKLNRLKVEFFTDYIDEIFVIYIFVVILFIVHIGKAQRSDVHKLVPSYVTKSHQRNVANEQIGNRLEFVVELKPVSRKDDALTFKEKYGNRIKDSRNYNILAKKSAYLLESSVTYIAVRGMSGELWGLKITLSEGSAYLKFSLPYQSLLHGVAFSTSLEAIAIQKNYQTGSKFSVVVKVFESNPKQLQKQIGITYSNVVPVSSVNCSESEDTKTEIPFDRSHEGKEFRK